MARTLKELGIEVKNLPTRLRTETEPPELGDAPRSYSLTAADAPDGVHVVSVFGSIDPWGWATDDLKMALDAIDDDVPVRVKITSPGGDPFQALAMYELLAKHEGRVEVEVQGFAQSAAAFLAMAGEVRRIGELGFFMIHGCQLRDFYGNRQDTEAIVDLMSQVDDLQARIFAAATGQSEETVRGWLNGPDAWFNAERAVEVGLATEIVPSEELTAAAAPLKIDLAAVALQSDKPPTEFVAAIGRMLTHQEEDETMPETKKTPADAGGHDIAAEVRKALPDVLGEELPKLLAAALPDALKASGITGKAAEGGGEPDPDDDAGDGGGKVTAIESGDAKTVSGQLQAIQAKMDALQKAHEEDQAASRRARISNELDRAQRAGRIIPALRTVWESSMLKATGADLDALVEELHKLPVTAPGSDPDLEAMLTGLDEGEMERLSATAIPARLLPPGMDESQMDPSARIAAKKCLAAAAGKTGDEAYDAVRAAWYKQNGGTAPAHSSDQPIFGGN